MLRRLSQSVNKPEALHRILRPTRILKRTVMTFRQSDQFTTIPQTDSLASYQLFSQPIVTSDNDKRQYRLIRLPNALQAILVHDPKADKAAAALSVNVGHLSDPEDLPGLAHFCEHLLFMGNEKYPSENEYSEYLAKHSGYSNAFTGMDDTVYYFEVHPTALQGALDRFAQFFISPLFTPSCTEREIRAVDSENSKNLQSDNWRMFQLDKHTSSRTHSFWRFGTGNLYTLWDRPKSLGLDVRDELLKFYKRHYSSNIMTLAVSGTDSLDELTDMVVKNFATIKDSRVTPDRFDGSPYTANELGKLIFTQLVKDNNLLEITFPMPDQDPFYDTQPSGFLSHYIGHEGAGSATGWLKGKGWVRTFQCGPGGGATGFDLFKITLDLTPEGLLHYKQVVQVIFAYLDLLRSTPPQEWSFREQAQLSETRFKFKSQTAPGQYAITLAGCLRRPCPRAQILSSAFLTNTFDAPLIQSTAELFRPELCRIVLASQSGLEGVDLELKEPYYGTPYTIKPIPSEIFDPEPRREIIASGVLSLPKPNSFVSTDFTVIKNEVEGPPSRRPKCIRDDAYGRVWHKKDDRWWVPRASAVVMIRNPITDQNCLNTIKAQYIAKLLKESLNESLYEAEIAGLGYSIHHDSDSLTFNVDGYNQKLSLLLETVLKGLKDLKVDRQKFELVKDGLVRRYQNFMLDGPSRIGGYWLDAALVDVHYNYEQKLEGLKVVTPEDVEAFIPELLSHGFVETLVHGNLTADEALQMSDLPKKILQLGPVGQDELRKSYSLTVPPASNLVYELGLINPSNLNSSVNYFIDLGDIAVHTMRNNLALLSQLISEPAFNQLRTVEQLGYIVQTSSRRCPGQCGWIMCIQSEKPPAFVESRIEEFLHWFLDEKLAKMDEEEFMAQKKSLVNKITEDFKNLWEESSYYWTHIHSGYYAFEQRHLDAELIHKITKQEMIDFYRTHIHPSSPTRAKLSVQVRSQKVPVPAQILEALIPSSPSDEEPEGWKALVQRKPNLTELFKFLDDHGLSDKKQTVVDAVDGYDKVGDRFLDHAFLVNKPVVIPSRGEGNNGIEGLRTMFGRSAVVGPVPDWKG